MVFGIMILRDALFIVILRVVMLSVAVFIVMLTVFMPSVVAPIEDCHEKSQINIFLKNL
jgi:hypothetical protein